jgi:hypothetical protein
MLISRLPIFRFAAKKQVKQPGIIIDPESFRNQGTVDKVLHWFRNIQTYNDMERHLKDFHRSKSHTFFLQYNNKLIDALDRRNFRDLDVMVSEEYFKVFFDDMQANKE